MKICYILTHRVVLVITCMMYQATKAFFVANILVQKAQIRSPIQLHLPCIQVLFLSFFPYQYFS